MAQKFPIKLSKEMIAGLITLGLALILLAVTAICMTQCSAVLPEPTQDSPSTQTTAPVPTEPTLIPNPYSAGDFGYRDGNLTCLSGQSRLGVDVSAHQGIIDWPAVAADGIEFAIIRLGYRGWGNGQLVADTMAITNLIGAADAGLDVGVYFYSQAITVEEAREEAQFVLEILDGRTLDLPIVFDWEIFGENGRTYSVGGQTLNACALAFCQAVEDAGYEAMIYYNLDLAVRLYDLVSLQEQGYPFWLALYTDAMTYPHRVDFWQYSYTGRVKGIETDVDLNLQFIYD